MPRRSRLNLPAAPMHIIQRGNNPRATFFADPGRSDSASRCAPTVPMPRPVPNPDRASACGGGREKVAGGPGWEFMLPMGDSAGAGSDGGDRPLPAPALPPRAGCNAARLVATTIHDI